MKHTNTPNIEFYILWICCALLALLAERVSAQTSWCGYALIQYPLLDTQLSVLAALTPGYDPYSSQPDTLFQHRWNLARTEVLVEGCFSVVPDRALVVSLLDSVLDQSYEEIEASLGYTLFVPDQSRDVAAAVVRAFIQANAPTWEPPA